MSWEGNRSTSSRADEQESHTEAESLDTRRADWGTADRRSEAAGSLACARKITELKMECDIIAVADYKVIDQMLIPEYCKWNIPFAGNEMIIAYTNRSEFADEMNSGNWYKILARENVRIGRSDPDSDPCGYRTVLTLQLADMMYNQDISDRWRYDVQARYDDIDAVSSLTRSTDREVFLFESRVFYAIDRKWTASASYRYLQRKFKSDSSDDRAPHSNRIYIGITYSFPILLPIRVKEAYIYRR